MCEIDKLKDENELGPQREEVEQLQDELNNLKDKVYWCQSSYKGDNH